MTSSLPSPSNKHQGPPLAMSTPLASIPPLGTLLVPVLVSFTHLVPRVLGQPLDQSHEILSTSHIALPVPTIAAWEHALGALQRLLELSLRTPIQNSKTDHHEEEHNYQQGQKQQQEEATTTSPLLAALLQNGQDTVDLTALLQTALDIVAPLAAQSEVYLVAAHDIVNDLVVFTHSDALLFCLVSLLTLIINRSPKKSTLQVSLRQNEENNNNNNNSNNSSANSNNSNTATSSTSYSSSSSTTTQNTSTTAQNRSILNVFFRFSLQVPTGQRLPILDSSDIHPDIHPILHALKLAFLPQQQPQQQVPPPPPPGSSKITAQSLPVNLRRQWILDAAFVPTTTDHSTPVNPSNTANNNNVSANASAGKDGPNSPSSSSSPGLGPNHSSGQSTDPSSAGLTHFAKTLKGQTVVLHATEHSLFARHLSSTFTALGVDIFHMPPLPYADFNAPDYHGAAFVVIDDDIDTLKRQLFHLRQNVPGSNSSSQSTYRPPGSFELNLPSTLLTKHPHIVSRRPRSANQISQSNSTPPPPLSSSTSSQQQQQQKSPSQEASSSQPDPHTITSDNQTSSSEREPAHQQQPQSTSSSPPPSLPTASAATSIPKQNSPTIVYFTTINDYHNVRCVIHSFRFANPLVVPTPGHPINSSSMSRIPNVVVVPKPVCSKRLLTALYSTLHQQQPALDPAFMSFPSSPLTPSGTMPHHHHHHHHHHTHRHGSYFSMAPVNNSSPSHSQHSSPVISQAPPPPSVAQPPVSMPISMGMPMNMGMGMGMGLGHFDDQSHPSPLQQMPPSSSNLPSSAFNSSSLQQSPTNIPPSPSPLQFDKLGYFKRAFENMGPSASQGIVIQSPDGRPSAIYFHPDAIQRNQQDNAQHGHHHNHSHSHHGGKSSRHRHTHSKSSDVSKTSPKSSLQGLLSHGDQPASPPPPAPLTPIDPKLPSSPTAAGTADSSTNAPHNTPPHTNDNTDEQDQQEQQQQQQQQQQTPKTPRVTPPPAVPKRTPSNSSKANAQHTVNPTPKINVLIVEDNRINQVILSTFLRRKGIKYDIATNGEDAVEKWKNGDFQLILMDIQLPKKSGIEATQDIRTLEKERAMNGVDNEGNKVAPIASPTSPVPQSVIIVALTAGSHQSDRTEALAAGCNDFLTKPVSLTWLQQKLTEWGSMAYLSRFSYEHENLSPVRNSPAQSPAPGSTPSSKLPTSLPPPNSLKPPGGLAVRGNKLNATWSPFSLVTTSSATNTSMNTPSSSTYFNNHQNTSKQHLADLNDSADAVARQVADHLHIDRSNHQHEQVISQEEANK